MSGDKQQSKTDFLIWQSPLHAAVAASGEWRAIADSEIIETTNGDEMQFAAVAGVCDLSPLPRSGGKGICTPSLPQVNQSVVLDGGGVCCRLAKDELLLLADDGSESANIADIVDLFQGRFMHILRRDSHCQIGLCGERAVAVLSEVCALPPPLPGVVLQSRAADIGVFIIGAPHSHFAKAVVLSAGR